MKFAESINLYWLWAVVLLAVLFYFVLKRHRMLLQRFAQDALLNEIAANVHVTRLLAKKVLFLLIFVFSIFALARPQWGFEWREIRRQGIDIILVVDTSRSMLTRDVKPNRLERTKLAIRDLLKQLDGDRVGLIAFAGKAFLVCPLTVDYQGIMMSLQDLDINSIPRGGTNLAEAIKEAIKQYDETASQYKAVVVITDGENLEDDPLKFARKAKEAGIKIYTVGIGTQEGELIRILNSLGEEEYLKDENGNVVKSRLNGRLLQDIALLTGGVYIQARGAQFGLDLLYDRELSHFEKRDIETKMEKRYFERFQIPLVMAFVLLVMETCLPYRKKED